ncbi:Aegerolysin Aa-Pri1 [Paramarasmius palmivorus]|uniref:Aegerolysin Aa-Pri1 n=1 Tax=Paramarasmius palmivorus TaxID=297713 RepID=A0AAW0CKG9_9AGAR
MASTESEVVDAVDDPRAYAQWVVIIIDNVGFGRVKLKNLSISWGKLYADNNKNKEVYPSQYEGQIIGPDGTLQLNACGRSNASSGTTGQFNLCDADDGDRVIRHFKWDCPWGKKRNIWEVSGSNSKWLVEHKGANLDSGALGTIYVDVLKKGTRDPEDPDSTSV